MKFKSLSLSIILFCSNLHAENSFLKSVLGPKIKTWIDRQDESYRQENQNVVIIDGQIKRLLPKDHITITKSSPEFDHRKFEELRSKYLEKVNNEIEEEKSKITIIAPKSPKDVCNPLLEVELDNSEILKNAPLWLVLSKSMDVLSGFSDLEEKLVLDRLKKCGINPDHVKILYGEKKDSRYPNMHVRNQNAAMSAYNSPFCREKSVLTIHNRMLEDLQKGTSNDYCLPHMLNNSAYMTILKTKFPYPDGKVLLRQAMEIMIAHEASHILHADSIMCTDIHSSGVHKEPVDKIVGLCEKRADLFAVFNSPNPIAAAIMCRETSMHSTTYNYKEELNKLETELRSCYSLPAKKMNPVPKVEHE